MNEKEWVEYFEALNGRKPSPVEFVEAIKNNVIISEKKQN